MHDVEDRLRLSRVLLSVVLSIAAGGVLRGATSLTPVGWLVWIAPVPVLWLALSIERRWLARLAVFIAATVACSSYWHYFSLVMPWPAVVLATLGQTLIWYAVLILSRRVMQAGHGAWTVLAYPLLWVMADTLMAALLPDGNWGSLAYSQADLPWVRQLAALSGTTAILFVLCLVPSTLALLLWRRQVVGKGWMLATTCALVLASWGYGTLRAQHPLHGTATVVGLASIDDTIQMQAFSSDMNGIRARYDALIERLAGQGATLVILPEKIAITPPAQVWAWQAHFSEIAARHRIWLEVGMAIDDGQHPRNQAWLFDPTGLRVANYQKHFMAPPERAQGYAVGHAFDLLRIDGARMGLAVCKDMHFATFGRAYGQRQADVMLVPAWDFAYLDAWMASRMSALRGVENGYAVIRASREGLLSVSDAHGHFIAQTRSAPMPGASLLAPVAIGPAQPTLYTRIGNAPGWLCAGLAMLMLAGLRRGRRA